MARSRLVASIDLPVEDTSFQIFTVVRREVRQNGSIQFKPQPSYSNVPSVLRTRPNLSLVWNRYLPAHDWKKRPPVFNQAQAPEPSPCGIDVLQEYQLWTDNGRDGRVVKKASESLVEWSGSGVLEWYCHLVGTSRDSSLLEALRARRILLLNDGGVSWLTVKNHWRCAIGLGNAASVENSGISIHRFGGFPVLPGSSLKGLSRHFFLEEIGPSWDSDDNEIEELKRDASEWAGEEAASDIRKLADMAFGEGGTAGREGLIVFHDGWATTAGLTHGKGWYEPDVLTSHHMEYYDDRQPTATDRDQPNPVHFLAVRPGVMFEIPVGLTTAVGNALETDEKRQAVVKWATSLLAMALESWGIGAKTGSGYGRMVKEGNAQDLAIQESSMADHEREANTLDQQEDNQETIQPATPRPEPKPDPDLENRQRFNRLMKNLKSKQHIIEAMGGPDLPSCLKTMSAETMEWALNKIEKKLVKQFNASEDELQVLQDLQRQLSGD